MSEPTTLAPQPSFSRLHRYIGQLSDGLESYPDCRAKASVHRRVLEISAPPLTGLPPVLQALVDEPPPANTWIPQCHALALILAAIEVQQNDPQSEHAWTQRASAHVFDSPMYRILMWAATPRLLFKGANLRWSAFFKGSSLEAVLSDRTAELILSCPATLFNQDLAEVFEDVLTAAAAFTEEGRGGIELELYRPGEIVYRAWW